MDMSVSTEHSTIFFLGCAFFGFTHANKLKTVLKEAILKKNFVRKKSLMFSQQISFFIKDGFPKIC